MISKGMDDVSTRWKLSVYRVAESARPMNILEQLLFTAER